MKILHLNTNDLNGGAARAAYRLHTSLNTAGYDSYMLVMNKQSDERKIIKLKQSKWIKLIDVIYDFVYKKCFTLLYRPTAYFSTNRLVVSSLIANIRQINPDIIHLHWVTDQFINLHDLLKLKIPVFWSLHDMWAFTGGCHYNDTCSRYELGCNKCPLLRHSLFLPRISRKEIYSKREIYSKLNNFCMNGLSRWMMREAMASYTNTDYQIINLPNVINTNDFSNVSQDSARCILGLPLDSKIIIFGAMNAVSDSRKGFDLLVSALNQMNNKKNIQLVIFGSSHYDDLLSDFPVKCLGHLHDDCSLKLLYSAADVMVVPSRQENLANTIMESLACGTPVVAFDIGGNSDMVDHEQNGYLAKPFDCSDLSFGISWVIYNSNYEQLSTNARKKVLDNFSEEIVVPKYIAAYNDLLHK